MLVDNQQDGITLHLLPSGAVISLPLFSLVSEAAYLGVLNGGQGTDKDKRHRSMYEALYGNPFQLDFSFSLGRQEAFNREVD